MSTEDQVKQENSSNETITTEDENSEVKIENVEETNKGTLHLKKNKQQVIPDNEAAKIRQSTEHKVSRKYDKELAEKNRMISELETKLKTRSNPPDDQSEYDEYLGMWINKDTSREEYKNLIFQKGLKDKQIEEAKKFMKPVTDRIVKVKQNIPDFENVLVQSEKMGLVGQPLFLLAGSTEGGLEVLYDLAKNRSQKLLELQKMLPVNQVEELVKLAAQRNANLANSKSTQSDHPIEPLTESANKDVSYANMNFKDGYSEFKKRRKKM